MSEISPEKMVMLQVRDSIAAAIKSQLEGYSSPLKTLVDVEIRKHDTLVREMISEAISGVLLDKEMRQSIVQQIRHRAAKELASTFGEGVFKKTVDALKSDHVVKAKCILAIEAIIEAANKP